LTNSKEGEININTKIKNRIQRLVEISFSTEANCFDVFTPMPLLAVTEIHVSCHDVKKQEYFV